ncbi:MAG TPA: succinylglutamate desuccinylase/aspartoacylase family protein [Alphaproteobacteria bacterium]|jgi:predicted deacylase|nr:succinylglutamate desuccinylase/aspartoacylase family protein [Alphaproteobacteria bacterium]MDP6270752.1 succinylglutamate desuccinylase/aspartoacylase family protein [Alphaproteobacteria bacterium]MDP7426621.1 succinylglutamate desuccinylase/aspartoacylase family protein [Alphaproteobacteria bacterium]HJM50307.1 succinylglutamate desuccinylase/aspartoacylase family protein [Alphaproteobacteria bacterium]
MAVKARAKAKTKTALKVGTAVARRGRRTKGRLVLGAYPDSDISSPVIIASGSRAGPVLWVQCCVHGPEVGGPVALLRFLDKLDLKTITGTIVAVMTANPTSFRGYSRNTPIDGENLNRVFPGDPAGPHSRQTANILFRNAKRCADAVLDLHSGGDRSFVPFYALYWNDGSATAQRAGQLARAAGTPDIWASTDSWLAGTMFTNLTQQGLPALIVECGGGAQVPEAHLENYLSALNGVARAMGILPGRPRKQKKYRLMDDAPLVYSQVGGLFEPAVEPGEVVALNQELGRIHDLFGDLVEIVRSPRGPAYVASIRRRYMPVYSGDQIAEVIRILEDR